MTACPFKRILDALCEWSKAWQMSFNTTKCHAMHVTHKTKPLLMDYNMERSHLTLSKNTTHIFGIELSKGHKLGKHTSIKSLIKANKIPRPPKKKS